MRSTRTTGPRTGSASCSWTRRSRTRRGAPEATAYLTGLCLNERALFDEDDFQVGADPYGRVLAVVYCGGANANAALIASGHATTYVRFCSASEFEREAWTGCP